MMRYSDDTQTLETTEAFITVYCVDDSWIISIEKLVSLKTKFL